MRFEFIYEPVLIVIVRDVFTNEENREILDEVIDNESKFESSTIGKLGPVPDFRSNLVAHYDDIYIKDRTKSKLLKKLGVLFYPNNNIFDSVLYSSPYPLNEFGLTNHHETQVSRYGDEGQQYKYHIDGSNNTKRQISVVYYMFEEPKTFEGGDIMFTRSPVFDGKVLDPSQESIKIVPENNMMVVFGSHVPHMVLPTTSPKDFSKGRFSVNCWVGRQ
tara:strand:- start:572 stop:1225 length:654 start_codon:yes stop_codon:yes gene_type:complete